MTLAIREASFADIPTLFLIRTAVRENHMTLVDLAAAGVTPDTVADLLRSDTAAIWLGLCDEEPAGFAIARADRGDLFALFVHPDREGQGLGSRLLAKAEHWLASRGIGSAWLLTGADPDLRASRLYASRGWQVTSHEPDGQARLAKTLAESPA